MKKIIIFLNTIFTISTLLFGLSIEDFYNQKDNFNFITESEICYIYRNNKKIIIYSSYSPIEIIELLPDDIHLDNNGYQIFTMHNKNYLLLQSEHFINTFREDNPQMSVDWCVYNDYRFANNSMKQITDIKDFLEARQADINKFNDIYFRINKIDSSSYYIEKTKSGNILYISDYLNILYYSDFLGNIFLQHTPWIPGKKNNSSGIGEYLDIEFTEPKDNIVVLNGYVDLEKRYLYKANNRVKTAVIKSLDENNPFEIEYEFEDYVHFSEINFPCKVNKVRFTIKEVYKGEKWNDTCVTAVITR